MASLNWHITLQVAKKCTETLFYLNVSKYHKCGHAVDPKYIRIELSTHSLQILQECMLMKQAEICFLLYAVISMLSKICIKRGFFSFKIFLSIVSDFPTNYLPLCLLHLQLLPLSGNRMANLNFSFLQNFAIQKYIGFHGRVWILSSDVFAQTQHFKCRSIQILYWSVLFYS